MGQRAKPMFNVLILDGRTPPERELFQLRGQLEIFDAVEGANDELRKLVAERWPHLLPKLQPSGRERSH